VIYAIRAKGTEYIKFGYAQGLSLETRISTLQTGCPHDLELLACCLGDIKLERKIHNRLLAAGDHHRGEWFKDGPIARAIIRHMKGEEVDSVLEADSSAKPMREAKKHKRLGAVLELSHSLAEA
jgi:hypothetical protein